MEDEGEQVTIDGQTLPIDDLKWDMNIREIFDAERLAGMGQTIKETGVLLPILVERTGPPYRVVDGGMRVRAAQLAGLDVVPVVFTDSELSDGELTYRQLVANIQRVDLSPIEKSKAVAKLMREAGWSASELAAKLGISPGTVTKLLSILSLPQEIQDRVGSPGLGLSAAYQISLAGNAEAQARMADELASGAITRDDAAARRGVRKSRRRPSAKRERSRVGRNRATIALGDKRFVTFAGPDLSLSNLIEWVSGLLERLRGAADRNADLSEAVKLASGA